MKLIPLLFSLLLLLPAGPALAEETPPSATEQVRQTVDRVLEILRDHSLQGEERRQQLSQTVRHRFEFSIMAQRTLGKYWQDASADEQKRFVALFSDLLEGSYIGRVEAYSDEQVLFVGERLAGDRAEVATLVRNTGGDIPIDYRLVLVKGEWLVYDVIVEDVSLIKNYRGSYGEIVRNEGFTGLFARMEEKIRQLRTEPDNS
ncbi:MAG: ABC transporter substrate-binding protein [Desulfuromonadales bacterium]|nr:ABC transporter substrate-binding protein [Desulfuromonadales bacterium]